MFVLDLALLIFSVGDWLVPLISMSRWSSLPGGVGTGCIPTHGDDDDLEKEIGEVDQDEGLLFLSVCILVVI